MDYDLDDLMRRKEKPWMPHKEFDQPHHITGTVVRVGVTFAEWQNADVPRIGVVPRDDGDTLWSVTGYGAVLRRELTDQRPRPGDQIGLKYEGMAAGAKGEYPRFRVVVVHASEPEPQIDWDAIEKTLPNDDEGEEPF